MAHFLVIEDEKNIRANWCSLLEAEGHTFEEAATVDEAIAAIEQSESNEGEPFDLLLLDHNLDDETGIQLVQFLDEDYCENRVVVITGNKQKSLPTEYATYGSIAHLMKPVSRDQFYATIDSTLERRSILVERRQDWEDAYRLLEEIGLLDSLEKLQIEAHVACSQYSQLYSTYQKLLEDLERTGGREQKIAAAYEKATSSLNSAEASFDSLYEFLEGFAYTQSFLKDVREIFNSDRLQFFLLQAYLKRIRENPQSQRIRNLTETAGHCEYRIGRAYRLYFRFEQPLNVLERFGNKKLQPKILEFLKKTTEPPIGHLDQLKQREPESYSYVKI